MLFGILIGLLSAVFQSSSYLVSRVTISKLKVSPPPLMIVAHVWIGLFNLIMISFVWPDRLPPLSEFWWPVVGCSGFYLIGQAFLFVALKRTDASRVSPLLGLKVLLLAIFSVAFLGTELSPLQWIAALLAALAAAMLNRSGGSLDRKTLGLILLTCIGYALSDLHIRGLLDAFDYLDLLQRAVFTSAMCHVLCGSVSLVISLILFRKNKKLWYGSFPFAITWFVSIPLLFACFALIGVIYGNIVQSTRGIVSIGLGSIVAAAGYEYVEKKISRGVLIRRAVAAILMFAAIGLYYLGS